MSDSAAAKLEAEAPAPPVPELRFPDRYLNTEEAAKVLHVSPRTMANRRALGQGPPYFRTKPVLYALSDLTAWLAEQRCDPTR